MNGIAINTLLPSLTAVAAASVVCQVVSVESVAQPPFVTLNNERIELLLTVLYCEAAGNLIGAERGRGAPFRITNVLRSPVSAHVVAFVQVRVGVSEVSFQFTLKAH
jgi:hypothetical protein